MALKNRILIKGLGMITIAGCLSLVVTDGIAILMRQNYNPLSGSVSDLTLGPTGWIQMTGMLLGGLGIVSCAIGLRLALNGRRVVKLGELFLLIIGLAIMLAAVFKTDMPGLVTKLHVGSGVAAAILFLPVCFLVLPALRERKGLFAYTIVAGVLGVALYVASGRLPFDWVFFGLQERAIGGNALVWVSTVAWVMLLQYRDSHAVIEKSLHAHVEPSELNTDVTV